MLWRRVMLSERQHQLLVHVLESLLRDGIVGAPTRRVLCTIRTAKRVSWDDPLSPEERGTPQGEEAP